MHAIPDKVYSRGFLEENSFNDVSLRDLYIAGSTVSLGR